MKSCPVCSATFAKTNHLVRHMNIHNRPPDAYKHTCQECGMSFTKVFQLMKHKREHKVEKKSLKNGIETYKLNDSTDIVINSFKTETKKIKTEPVASKVSKYNVVRDSQGFFPCDVCKKLLTTASGLHIHMRRHTGDNLSTCHVSMILIRVRFLLTVFFFKLHFLMFELGLSENIYKIKPPNTTYANAWRLSTETIY